MKNVIQKYFRFIFPAFLYGFLTVIFNWEIVKHPLSVIEKNDGRLLAWTISWDNHKILTDPLNIFQANIFYPNLNTLSYSEHFIGGSILAMPIYLLTGGSPVASFNFLLLLSFFLNGLSSFLLVKYLTKSWSAGLIGGIIFGFCSYKVFNIGHLQNLVIFYIPLMLLFLHKYKDTKKLKYLVLTALCLLMQSLTSWYHMIFIFLLFGIFLLFFWWKRYFNKKDIKRIAISLIFVLLIIIPFALPYFEFNKQNASAYNIGDLTEYSADFGGYLLPSPNTYIGSEILPKLKINKSDWSENFNFVGYIALFLAIIGGFAITFRKKVLSISIIKDRGIYIFSSLVFFILSLGPVLHIADHSTRIPLPYYVIYYALPPIRFIRAVSRYSSVVFLMLAVLAGFGIAFILSKQKKRLVKIAIIVILTPLIVLEYFPTHSYTEYADVGKVPEIYLEVKNNSDIKNIVELPINVGPFETTKYIYYAGIHYKGLVNGYSGFEPKNYQFIRNLLTEYPNEVSYAKLYSIGVTHILVNPTYQQNLDLNYLDLVKSEDGYKLYKIKDSIKELKIYVEEFGSDNIFKSDNTNVEFKYNNLIEKTSNESTPFGNIAPVSPEINSSMIISSNENIKKISIKGRAFSSNDFITIECNKTKQTFTNFTSLGDNQPQTAYCNDNNVLIDLKSKDFNDRSMINKIVVEY